MTVLVTGAAGFIGSYVSHLLLDQGRKVVGYDNMNAYYDVSLKQARLDRLTAREGFSFIKADLENLPALQAAFTGHGIVRAVNLAAQAGVRYSLEQPHSYINSNVQGFLNILECARHQDGFEHLVFASTSSVYGANRRFPLSEDQPADHQMSLYAATKKANESMAHSYAHLFKIPITGVRFFTVYGPWGRPDMALFKFTRAILSGAPIDVFNHGDMARDFTFIDDIAEGVVRLLGETPVPASQDMPLTAELSPVAPYRLYNIGASRRVPLMDYIAALEENLGRKAEKNFLGIQKGDVPSTWADVSRLEATTGYRPKVAVKEGVARFVEWYLDYYNARSHQTRRG